jgi:hypothetical protein
VNFERVAAVFEVVARTHGCRRQLAWFANGREPGSQPIGDR